METINSDQQKKGSFTEKRETVVHLIVGHTHSLKKKKET